MYRPTTATSVLLGILSIIIGIVALAVYAFSRSFVQAALAFRSRAVGPVLGHLVLALIDVAAAAPAGPAHPFREFFTGRNPA
jgi:uncharacterized YccA/Bax inhibitor family protein